MGENENGIYVSDGNGHGNEVIAMGVGGEIWYEKSVPAHLCCIPP